MKKIFITLPGQMECLIALAGSLSDYMKSIVHQIFFNELEGVVGQDTCRATAWLKSRECEVTFRSEDILPGEVITLGELQEI